MYHTLSQHAENVSKTLLCNCNCQVGDTVENNVCNVEGAIFHDNSHSGLSVSDEYQQTYCNLVSAECPMHTKFDDENTCLDDNLSLIHI